jgi:hypothetical protein
MDWLTSLAGIVVGIVAFASLVLSIYNLLADERKRKRGIDSVYLLIYVEIEHNMDRLHALWRGVSVESPGMSQSDQVADGRAFRLAHAEAPQWITHIWQANATRVNDALDANQIRAVLSFYAQLDRLKDLQADVIKAHALAFPEPVPIFETYTVAGPSTLKELVEWQEVVQDRAVSAKAAGTFIEKYHEFERLAVDVLVSDNPLPAPRSVERKRAPEAGSPL